jgi:hypothetical protein
VNAWSSPEFAAAVAVPGDRNPIRATFPAGCVSAVSGTTSRLKARVTKHPTARYHIVVSLLWPPAHLLLAVEAERPR